MSTRKSPVLVLMITLTSILTFTVRGKKSRMVMGCIKVVMGTATRLMDTATMIMGMGTVMLVVTDTATGTVMIVAMVMLMEDLVQIQNGISK